MSQEAGPQWGINQLLPSFIALKCGPLDKIKPDVF